MNATKSAKKVIPDSAFITGWSQVPPYAREDVMERLKKVFGIKSKVQFYTRMRGEVEVRKSQIEGIEEVFHSHGITDIWGIEPYSKSYQ